MEEGEEVEKPQKVLKYLCTAKGQRFQGTLS